MPQHPKTEEPQDEVAVVESAEKTSILKPGILFKAAILVIVNLLVVGGVVFLLDRLESKALEVKKLRSIQLTASHGEPFSALKADVEAAESKTGELLKYYPDSEGLIAFVGEIDKLKAEGVVTGFSFANEEPIKDNRTGAFGLPVLIELKGNWAAIDSALGRIMSLPYLLRSIRIDATPSEEEGLIEFKFGGLLYVDKNFSQN